MAWVTFDCYGTLIDWRTGMTEALEPVAPKRSAELIETYHEFEPLVQAEKPYRRYRDVLAEALGRTADRLGVSLTGAQLGVLAETLPSWPAFADSVESLNRLRAQGWQLGILSNVDDEMIEQTLAGPLPVPFDEVVTSEQVGSYKPADGMYDEFLRRRRPSIGEWVHVGMSVFHDCEPAHQRGFKSVLIDRSEVPVDPGCADRVLPDLTGLAETLREIS